MRSLGKKTPFLAFPEAKKGVVNFARLRKAAHWPNNNANPSGLSEKKVYCVERRDAIFSIKEEISVLRRVPSRSLNKVRD